MDLLVMIFVLHSAHQREPPHVYFAINEVMFDVEYFTIHQL